MVPMLSSLVSRLVSSIHQTLPNDSSSPDIVRIMRVIVALGLCAETGVEEYKANQKTGIMTIPQGISSFKAW